MMSEWMDRVDGFEALVSAVELPNSLGELSTDVNGKSVIKVGQIDYSTSPE